MNFGRMYFYAFPYFGGLCLQIFPTHNLSNVFLVVDKHYTIANCQILRIWSTQFVWRPHIELMLSLHYEIKQLLTFDLETTLHPTFC